MGYYVHIHVSFACDWNDGVAALAARHAEAFQNVPLDDGTRYAKWFLDDLAQRTGENKGPKGGLSLWGMVGNYTRADEFCECLKPFWRDLLSGEMDSGPGGHAHVIVFAEREQTERAEAYEIWRADDGEGEIVIKHHVLPFAWMQM
jgi:hypothetical protein